MTRKRPKLILHVGTEKTGSTSIQESLAASYEQLLEAKILFPRSIGAPCHIQLTACALDQEADHPIRKLLGLEEERSFRNFRRDLMNRLAEEIARTSPTKVVISDEHIAAHLSTPAKLKRYKDMCTRFGDVEQVIIYLRQQDEFRLSLFSEAIRSGNIRSFDVLNPLARFDVIPYRFNYSAILSNLSSVFGQHALVTRIFDVDKFSGSDVVQDFAAVAGMPIDRLMVVTGRKNQAIDARILKRLATISSFLKQLNFGFTERLRLKIIGMCQEVFSGNGPMLAREAHESYLAQFEEQNRLIKEQYFQECGTDLFPNRYLGIMDNKRNYPGCTISWMEFFYKLTKAGIGMRIGRRAKSQGHRRIGGPSYQGAPPKRNAEQREGVVNASCPVCGIGYGLNTQVHSREGKLCPGCGASGRAQAISLLVSRLICGNSLPLSRQRPDRSKKIVGLSDGRVYADILSRKFDYKNTFYHREPLLDITQPPGEYIGEYDLIISSEVFEHVVGPSISAFRGAYQLLKPGGYMILTVPFVNKGEAVEHYDNLKSYTAHQTYEGAWVAELEFEDGRTHVDKHAKFHGGPGKTLEMRVFNRERVIQELRTAGFEEVQIYDENLEQHGINWGPASRPITARRPELNSL